MFILPILHTGGHTIGLFCISCVSMVSMCIPRFLTKKVGQFMHLLSHEPNRKSGTAVKRIERIWSNFRIKAIVCDTDNA